MEHLLNKRWVKEVSLRRRNVKWNLKPLSQPPSPSIAISHSEEGRNPLADAFSMLAHWYHSQGCRSIKSRRRMEGERDVGLKSHLIKLWTSFRRWTRREIDNNASNTMSIHPPSNPLLVSKSASVMLSRKNHKLFSRKLFSLYGVADPNVVLYYRWSCNKAIDNWVVDLPTFGHQSA